MMSSADECAHEVLDVVPLLMRTIRAELRQRRAADLSVPQYRAMLFVNRRPAASLSEVAEHLGLTPPSTSTLIDGLVERGLVLREACTSDRRRITLSLSAEGCAMVEATYRDTCSRLAEVFTDVPAAERELIVQALQALRRAFDPVQTTEP
jgi:DNA-binding MarR family transcriptional regulator